MEVEFKVVNKKLLVISPYFNRAPLVERTLKSLSNQSFDEMNILVWDDCSPDDTWQKLKDVKSDLGDERLTIWKNKENLGLTKSLNKAFDIAEKNGFEYVAIVGSGDICDYGRMSKQVDELERHPEANFCATRSYTIDEITGVKFEDDYFDKQEICLKDVLDTVPFTHGSVMYRTKAVIEVGGYENVFKWCADWDLFIRLLTIGNARYINEFLYTRFALQDGVSFHPKKSIEQIKYRTLVKYLAFMEPSERKANIEVAERDLDSLLFPFRKNMSQIALRREIKLLLMGRSKEARTLSQLSKENFGNRYYILPVLASVIGKLPFDVNRVLKIARKLKNNH